MKSRFRDLVPIRTNVQIWSCPKQVIQPLLKMPHIGSSKSGLEVSHARHTSHPRHSSHALFVLAFSPGFCNGPLHLIVTLLIHLLHHVHQPSTRVFRSVWFWLHGLAF